MKANHPINKCPAKPAPPHFDVFISHASEDKEAFVMPLAKELDSLGVTAWFDKTTLKLGDSLRANIDQGLACSDYGVVILSHAFFAKDWPKRELAALLALEVNGRKVILPVRHGLTHDELLKYSPLLADKLAALAEEGISAVARQILQVVRPADNRPAPAPVGQPIAPIGTPPQSQQARQISYPYDVFLAHNPADTATMQELAHRLKAEGVSVWFADWEIAPGDVVPEKREAGLSASRTMLLAISQNSMGAQWPALQRESYRFQNSPQRRLIPLQLDNTQMPEALQHIHPIDWRNRSPQSYAKLLTVFRPEQPEPAGSVASIARVYDYFLGGGFNTLADRIAAAAILDCVPFFKDVLISNRAFLRRAVRCLTEAGIKQFLDIGSGLPTRGNVHEIAQGIAPDTKVVYVDNDKQVIEASGTLLKDEPNTRVLQGDLAAPASFLSAPELHLLDFNKPTALLCVAVLHFVVDDATAISAIDTLKMKLVPGSYLVIAHGSRAKPFAHITKPLGPTYRKWVGPVKQRPSQDILRFFDGTTLVDPGLAFTPEWRPKIHDPYLPYAKLPFTQFPEQSLMLAGVGRV